MDSEISKDELYTEKLMNMILDIVDDIIIIHDSCHTVIWMNKAAEKAFGKSADQVIVKVMREENLTVDTDFASGTMTVSFGEDFETGSFAVMLADAEGNVIIRPVYVTDLSALPDYYGIMTSDDLSAFAAAVNAELK